MTAQERDDALATRYGTLYPEGRAIAVVRDGEAAQAASTALRQAGWSDSDVTLVTGSDFLAEEAQRAARQNPLERLAGFLASDEALNVDQFRDFAEQGAWLVIMRAANDDEATRAAAALEHLQPLAMYQYGANATSEVLRPDLARERNP